MLNIIYILNGDWENDHRRPQEEADAELCNLICCIERPISLLTIIRNPKAIYQWLVGDRKLRKIHDRLAILKPATLVPYVAGLKFPFLKSINKIILTLTISGLAKRVNRDKIIVIISHPLHDVWVGIFGEKVLCYEITDAHDKDTYFGNQLKGKMGSLEKKVASRADIIFCSSMGLFKAKRHLNKNIHYIPNGVDFERFHQAINSKMVVPTDLAATSRPRIGLIGHITENVDLEIVIKLSEQHSEWSIILIGSIKGSKAFLKSQALKMLYSFPKIHYLGYKDYESLPFYLKGMDVCLLPYKINEYNQYIYPNKVHQYLAAGKAVVSTSIPEMKQFEHVIFIAHNHEQFIGQVENAVKENESQREIGKRRFKVAQLNSVKVRAEQRISLLEEVLRDKINL